MRRIDNVARQESEFARASPNRPQTPMRRIDNVARQESEFAGHPLVRPFSEVVYIS